MKNSDQRLSSKELWGIGLIVLLPLFYLGYRLVAIEWEHETIRELIEQRRIGELRQWLVKAKAGDVIFQNYNLGSSVTKTTNALAFAAQQCDGELVQVFFEVASEKMSPTYLESAYTAFIVDSAASRCGAVGDLLESKLPR